MENKVYGFGFCNPVEVDEAYLSSTVDYCIQQGINHMQIIGPIHDTVRGNIDGMTLYKKYASFNNEKDVSFIERTMKAFADVLPKAHAKGIRSYIWHHELDLPTDFAKEYPETINEVGDYELTHPQIKDFLENKIHDFFEAYPLVDGIILTLHETKVPMLRLKGQKLDRSERVKYVTGILYDSCKALGKELIVRPFASLPEDYDRMLEAYSAISSDLTVMDKWTQFDWSLCLPHNSFYKKVTKNPLMVEADIFGEFFGKGRLPLMLLDHITDKINYCESFPITGYCARIDRNGVDPFGDVNEVNLAIMAAGMHNESTEAAAKAFFSKRYGAEAGPAVFDLMRNTEDIVRHIIYLKGYYFSELSYVPAINHSKNHFYFEMMRDSFELASGEWFIPIGWERGSLQSVLDEKAKAVADAGAACEKLEAIKPLLGAEDYQALWVKFTNLRLAAIVWELITKAFLHYTKALEYNSNDEEILFYQTLAKLQQRSAEGTKLLGSLFYCRLGNVGDVHDFIGGLVSELIESYETEVADNKRLQAIKPYDYVICGGGLEGHKLKKEVNFSDTAVIDGHLCRIPGHSAKLNWSKLSSHGWFSYELKTHADRENTIILEMGSTSEQLDARITLDIAGTEAVYDVHEPVCGTKILTLSAPAAEAIRVRVDRLNKNTPYVHSIRID